MSAPEPDVGAGLERLARLATFATSLVFQRPLAGSPLERAGAFSVLSARVLDEFGLTIERSGPVPLGPCVLVSNHLSWFDPLVVAACVPVTAIAKHEVSSWPWVGERAKELGIIFVDRASVTSGVQGLLAARRALEAGLSVLNFPEGTTTRGDSVLPFRRGLFGLARLLEVPVVPVRLDVDPSLSWVGDEPLLPHLWRMASRARPVVRLRFDGPLPPSPDSPDSPDTQEPDEARAERARQRIARRFTDEESPDAALCA